MKLKNLIMIGTMSCMPVVLFGACGSEKNSNAQQEETVADLFDKAGLLGSDTNVLMVTSGSVKEGDQCLTYSGKSKKTKKKDISGIEAINLNIQGIKNQSNAAPIEGAPGVYNILAEDFITRILAEANLPVGADVHMLRLMLAESGHSVVIEGTEYPLRVPSGVQSGYKLIFKEHNCMINSDTDLLLVNIQFKLIQNAHGHQLRPVGFIFCAHNDDPAEDPDDPCEEEEEEQQQETAI